MKLTTKHLATYLPYNLKVAVNNGFAELNGLGSSLVSIKEIDAIDSGMYVGLDEVKPLLRPLSKLTQTIKHNGKSFVPASVLWSIDAKEEDRFETFGTIPEYWKACIGLLSDDVRNVDYGDFEYLVKWHFDVFGLINKGLAIENNN